MIWFNASEEKVTEAREKKAKQPLFKDHLPGGLEKKQNSPWKLSEANYRWSKFKTALLCTTLPAARESEVGGGLLLLKLHILLRLQRRRLREAASLLRRRSLVEVVASSTYRESSYEKTASAEARGCKRGWRAERAAFFFFFFPRFWSIQKLRWQRESKRSIRRCRWWKVLEALRWCIRPYYSSDTSFSSFLEDPMVLQWFYYIYGIIISQMERIIFVMNERVLRDNWGFERDSSRVVVQLSIPS